MPADRIYPCLAFALFIAMIPARARAQELSVPSETADALSSSIPADDAVLAEERDALLAEARASRRAAIALYVGGGLAITGGAVSLIMAASCGVSSIGAWGGSGGGCDSHDLPMTLGWVGIGVGIGAIIAGVVLGALAREKRARAQYFDVVAGEDGAIALLTVPLP